MSRKASFTLHARLLATLLTVILLCGLFVTLTRALIEDLNHATTKRIGVYPLVRALHFVLWRSNELESAYIHLTTQFWLLTFAVAFVPCVVGCSLFNAKKEKDALPAFVMTFCFANAWIFFLVVCISFLVYIPVKNVILLGIPY